MRTYRLRQRFGVPEGLRLTSRDRAFLGDLARVGVIDAGTASVFHYADNQSGAGRRLDTLAQAGLLRRVAIIDPSCGPVVVYGFQSDRLARAFGGREVRTGPNRTTYHELLVSRSYFAVGRPADFRVTLQFSDADLARFGATRAVPPHRRGTQHGFAREVAIPDAVFTDASGALVVVEADAGHYTTRQIAQKQLQWSGYRQLWVQPARSHARVRPSDQVDVLRY